MPLNSLSPTKLSPIDIKEQEDKPLEWIHLHSKHHKILIAYLTLLTQLVKQGGPGPDINNYT